MRSIPPALQAHLDSGATTMCYCWRITRRDGLVQGFTDHDEDLTFDGTTFQASAGFSASQIAKSLGLAVDNMEVHGALSSASINEDDLALGLYDDALVELFWVNWSDVSQRIVQLSGFTGEAKRTGVAFTAELRGLSSRLMQTTTRTFQRTCDASVGDARCKVSLTGSFKGTGAVSTLLGSRAFTASGLGAFASGLFSLGTLTFTSGPNAGIGLEVKTHTKSTLGTVAIELWAPPAIDLAAGHAFEVTAGCDKTSVMCQSRFSNIANFRGFNRMPGPDTVLRNVDSSANNEGSSSTTTTSSKG